MRDSKRKRAAAQGMRLRVPWPSRAIPRLVAFGLRALVHSFTNFRLKEQEMNYSPSNESPNVAVTLAALRRIGSSPFGAPVEPGDALALAVALSAPSSERPRRRRRPGVPAGAIVELLPPVRRGAPRLEPASGSVPGLDPARTGVSVYRTVQAGRVGTRSIPEGARVLVAQRSAEAGDLLLVASLGSLRLVGAGKGGKAIALAESRVVGVVEGIIVEVSKARGPTSTL